jgi:hypothetical protein
VSGGVGATGSDAGPQKSPWKAWRGRVPGRGHLRWPRRTSERSEVVDFPRRCSFCNSDPQTQASLAENRKQVLTHCDRCRSERSTMISRRRIGGRCRVWQDRKNVSQSSGRALSQLACAPEERTGQVAASGSPSCDEGRLPDARQLEKLGKEVQQLGRTRQSMAAADDLGMGINSPRTGTEIEGSIDVVAYPRRYYGVQQRVR